MIERRDIERLVQACGGHAEAALRIGVSPVTLRRWEEGLTCPQARNEVKIRQVLAEAEPGGLSPCLDRADAPMQAYRQGLAASLHRLREALHAHGQLSSRHEALDEVSALFLAHALSALSGSGSLQSKEIHRRASSTGAPLAAALREAVEERLSQHLARAPGAAIGPGAFRLRLGDTEERLAEIYLSILDEVPRLPGTGPSGPDRASPARTYDLMNHLFSQFLTDSFQQERELGQYLTPDEVGTTMVELALDDLSRSELDSLLSETPRQAFGAVLDPSCGVASLLSRLAQALCTRRRASTGPQEGAGWLPHAWAELLVGIDKSPRMIKLALATATLSGAGQARLHLTNALGRGPGADPILRSLEGAAGLILSNPPFGAELSGEDLRSYQIAHCPGRPINSELLFLERYLDWLREGGRLITVVPDSILSNKGLYADLRDLLRARARLRAVISLPEATFGLAGTTTKTSILFMQRAKGAPVPPTYFFISRSLGFEVVTKGSQRLRVPTAEPDISRAIQGFRATLSGGRPEHGRLVQSAAQAQRWDASFHASLPAPLQALVDQGSSGALRVHDVAELINERADPRRSASPAFLYIEISSVSGPSLRVEAREVARAQTPTRARRVVQAGDVLVSTVRPSLRCVGVVPPHLNGAICTTGLAVLRPRKMDPYLLGRLLQSDAVVAQLERSNVGIAYPTFEEAVLASAVLPIECSDLQELNAAAARAREAIARAEEIQRQSDATIRGSTASWMAKQPVAGGESSPP